MPPVKKISSATVRADFNDPVAVIHYARAAHFMGLWASERVLIERHFTDLSAPLLEAGCGAGRATLGLWDAGYHNLTAFDFAEELIDQARSLAAERGATAIRFLHADATAPSTCNLLGYKPGEPAPFAGALFLFNGLMQIPGRKNRRAALGELHRVCAPGAPASFHHPRPRADPGRTCPLAPRSPPLGTRRTGPAPPRIRRPLLRGSRHRPHLHASPRPRRDLRRSRSHRLDPHLRRAAQNRRRRIPRLRDFSDECRFWVAHKN